MGARYKIFELEERILKVLRFIYIFIIIRHVILCLSETQCMHKKDEQKTDVREENIPG
jgi:hypothetical protein